MGVLKNIIREGTHGTRPYHGSRVVVAYQMWLYDGSEPDGKGRELVARRVSGQQYTKSSRIRDSTLFGDPMVVIGDGHYIRVE